MPFEREELARLKEKTTDVKVPVVRPPGASAPNANVIPARRGHSGHSIVPPPPPGDEGEAEEVIIEMSDDDDEQQATAAASSPRRSRSDTLSDPMTTSKLAESARRAPAPAAPAAPNAHVKRRGG